MASLHLIGYWRSEYDETPWPEARSFVDRTWPSATRETVIAYLVRGRTLEQYRGLSPCRLCGCHNGSKELTDGTYCWPEGLAHYLIAHCVRLPDEFVAHVEASADLAAGTPAPEFDHLGQRARRGGYDDDYQAWMAERANRHRRGEIADAVPKNWLNADIDDASWQAQIGWPSQNGR